MSRLDVDGSINTPHPSKNSVVEALAEDGNRCERLAEYVARTLDQEDGWIHWNQRCWTWYPSRLAVELRCVDDTAGNPLLYVDTTVVDSAEATLELLQLLNDLNAHSAGWWWWLDSTTRAVHCSITCVARVQEWWWPEILCGVLPYFAAVTESMADELARVSNGTVHCVGHPGRGVRPSVDGWIVGTRLGSREPCASLDLWLSSLELARLELSLDAVCDGLSYQVYEPLDVRILDENTEPRIALRRHWHPEMGWGWQLATLTGMVAQNAADDIDLCLRAVCLNYYQAIEGRAISRFGGWVNVPDVGLVHLTFIRACEIEMLIRDAGSSIGDIAALMIDGGTRARDITLALDGDIPRLVRPVAVTEEHVRQLCYVNWTAGRLGRSYLSQSHHPTSSETADAGDAWLTPRHLLICSFGVFNPIGPTVSSLELAFTEMGDDEPQWTLLHVTRHPAWPEMDRLGSGTTQEALADLIADALATTWDGVFGSGPEWLEIFAYHDAVLAGTKRFAQAKSDEDWRAQADELMTYAYHPWARVFEHPAPDSSPWADDADPIACWLEAITSEAVITGHKIYMRSAWEGAKGFRDSDWDPARAQSVADAIIRDAGKRVRADWAFLQSLRSSNVNVTST